jgi:hypothetical protein
MGTHTGSDPEWVRYYPRSAMLQLLGLSRDAELAHRRLCDYVWGGAEWPAPDHARAGEVGKVPRKLWPRVLRELHSVGWRTHRGRLQHPGVAAARDQAVAACEGRQAISRAGNHARWHRQPARDASLPEPTELRKVLDCGSPGRWRAVAGSWSRCAAQDRGGSRRDSRRHPDRTPE